MLRVQGAEGEGGGQSSWASGGSSRGRVGVTPCALCRDGRLRDAVLHAQYECERGILSLESSIHESSLAD